MILNDKQKTALEKYFQETKILRDNFTVEEFIFQFSIMVDLYENYLKDNQEWVDELEWIITSCFHNLQIAFYGKKEDNSNYWFEWAYDNINLGAIASIILDNQ